MTRLAVISESRPLLEAVAQLSIRSTCARSTAATSFPSRSLATAACAAASREELFASSIASRRPIYACRFATQRRISSASTQRARPRRRYDAARDGKYLAGTNRVTPSGGNGALLVARSRLPTLHAASPSLKTRGAHCQRWPVLAALAEADGLAASRSIGSHEIRRLIAAPPGCLRRRRDAGRS